MSDADGRSPVVGGRLAPCGTHSRRPGIPVRALVVSSSLAKLRGLIAGPIGETQAGQGGEGGEAGAGQSGAPQGGTSGMMSGGTSNGGTPGGEAGAGGAGPGLPRSLERFRSQRFGLHGAPARDRLHGHGRYHPVLRVRHQYAFWNNKGASVAISTLSGGGTLTMDLTSTPGWDSTHTISFGFLLRGAATATTVQVLVEDITVAVKADPQATPRSPAV